MYSTSTLPADGNGVTVPDEDMVPVKFVSYDEMGKLTGTFSEARYFYYHRINLGQKVTAGEGGLLTHYVEFVGETRAPVLRPRPQFEQSFDTTEIAVREPATLVDLPAAIVSFEGPVKGRHEHPGGDLVVGWTVPGTYTVTVEAFPYLPAEFTLTVGAPS